MMANREENNWHLDKRVSIATIFAVVIQLVVLLVGGSAMISDLKGAIRNNSAAIEAQDRTHAMRLDSGDRRIANLERILEMQQQSVQRQDVMLGRIETKITALSEVMTRMEKALQSQEDRMDRIGR